MRTLNVYNWRRSNDLANAKRAKQANQEICCENCSEVLVDVKGRKITKEQIWEQWLGNDILLSYVHQTCTYAMEQVYDENTNDPNIGKPPNEWVNHRPSH